VSKVLNARLDSEAEAAFSRVMSAWGTTQSNTVRTLILEADRRIRDEALLRDAQAARNDPADLAEAKTVLAEMAAIRAW